MIKMRSMIISLSLFVIFSFSASAFSFQHNIYLNSTDWGFFLSDGYGNSFNFSRNSTHLNTSLAFFLQENFSSGQSNFECGDLICQPSVKCSDINLSVNPPACPPIPVQECNCNDEIKEAMAGSQNLLYPPQANSGVNDFFDKYWWLVLVGIGAFVVFYIFKDERRTKQNFNVPPQPPRSFDADHYPPRQDFSREIGLLRPLKDLNKQKSQYAENRKREDGKTRDEVFNDVKGMFDDELTRGGE